MQAAGVPGSPILQPEEVHKNEQFIARDFFQDVTHPNGQTLRMTGDPFRLSNTANSQIEPAPTLGQNTTQVLQNLLHMSNDEIEALTTEKII